MEGQEKRENTVKISDGSTPEDADLPDALDDDDDDPENEASQSDRDRRLRRARSKKEFRARSRRKEEQECLEGGEEAPVKEDAAPQAKPEAEEAPPSESLAASVPQDRHNRELTDEEREKLDIGLDELLNVIKGVPVLDFLRNRLTNAREKGLDSLTLLGFYRISSRMLKEEFEKKREQLRKVEIDFEEQKKRNEAIGGISRPSMASASQPALQTLSSPPPLQKEKADAEKAKVEAIEEQATQLLFVLNEKLKQKEKKLTEYSDLIDKMKADFTNMRARTQQDIALQVDKTFGDLIVKLLPVLDNFERAVEAAKSTTDVNSLVKGVEMIMEQFEDVLRREGVEAVKAVGEPFDPKVHEAIGIVETDEHPEDTVILEAYRGYTLKSKILRPSMVKVTKKKSS
ncbi:MAG: nucleotide exchange factor GrpE [Candidatus Xenobiia bacterium LiM19]